MSISQDFRQPNLVSSIAHGCLAAREKLRAPLQEVEQMSNSTHRPQPNMSREMPEAAVAKLVERLRDAALGKERELAQFVTTVGLLRIAVREREEWLASSGFDHTMLAAAAPASGILLVSFGASRSWPLGTLWVLCEATEAAKPNCFETTPWTPPIWCMRSEPQQDPRVCEGVRCQASAK